MSQETNEYRAVIIIPIADAETDADWMNLNLGENVPPTFGNGLGLAPGGGWPATHQIVNMPLTTAAATLVLGYFREELPEGWDEMDKSARCAAAEAGEDAGLAATGKLLVMRDINSTLIALQHYGRIDTGGDELATATEPE